VDAIYVKDLTGGKIVSPSRQATIKRQLLEIFSGPDEKRGANEAASTSPERT
jgi:[protein-PII] uridylyltransferase